MECWHVNNTVFKHCRKDHSKIQYRNGELYKGKHQVSFTVRELFNKVKPQIDEYLKQAVDAG